MFRLNLENDTERLINVRIQVYTCKFIQHSVSDYGKKIRINRVHVIPF